jgi:hypothetical protein
MNKKLTRLLAVPTLIAFVMTATAIGFRPIFHSPSIGGDSGMPIRNDTANGLNTTAFDTLVGTVTVNLPDDIAAGDTVSGTVISEPKGKTSDEQAKNQDELNGYVVEVSEQPAPSHLIKKSGSSQIDFCKDPAKAQDDRSGSVCKKWSIPDGVSMVPVVLKNREGKIVSRTEVPVAPKANLLNGLKIDTPNNAGTPVIQKVSPTNASDYLTPPFGQAGKPLSVKGPFDGDFKNASVKLGNHTAKFLASSPRKVVVESPRDLNGVADIEIEYKGKTVAKCTYRSISVKLAADKLNLMNGEQTTLTMTLAGLIGLLSPVSVQLSNKSPGTVSMAGGETQTINVSPEYFVGDIFTTTRTLTGLKAGGFAINAVVDSSKSIQGNCNQGNGGGTPIYGPRPPDNPNGQPSAPPTDVDADGNPRTPPGPSHPVDPFRGRFRVTLNGFTVNHVTNHGLFQRPDAVTFHPIVGRVNADGTRPPHILNGDTNTIGMTPENAVQGGTSSPAGGFQTNDGFPDQRTPWQRTTPRSSAPLTIPPTIYFEGEIIQNTNATYIIPNIWSVDGHSNLDLVGSYNREVGFSLDSLGRRVGRMIRGENPQPLALASYLKPGARMGLNNTVTLDSGVMQDRPVGMDTMGGNGSRLRFGFRPQVLVLTYESADYMSRTSFGFGSGIVPVRYVDTNEFGGDYTLYLQVERMDTVAPCGESIVGSRFTGTGELRTNHPEAQAQGPFNSDVNLSVDFTDCRGTIRITNFPPLTSHSETSVGSNTSTMTMVSGGAGRFTSANRSISIPITLGLQNSLSILGNSTLPLTLTGAIDPATGTATLRGTGTFSGGQLGTRQGTVVVTGTFSPSP